MVRGGLRHGGLLLNGVCQEPHVEYYFEDCPYVDLPTTSSRRPFMSRGSMYISQSPPTVHSVGPVGPDGVVRCFHDKEASRFTSRTDNNDGRFVHPSCSPSVSPC